MVHSRDEHISEYRKTLCLHPVQHAQQNILLKLLRNSIACA